MATIDELKRIYDETRYKHFTLCIPYEMIDIKTRKVVAVNDKSLTYKLVNIGEDTEGVFKGIWLIYICEETNSTYNATEELLKDYEVKGWLKILD